MATPGRTSRTVEVSLVLCGRIDVDDERDIVDVDAAGSDIGGDEDRHGAVGKALDGAGACTLALVTVQRHRVDAGATQLLRLAIDAVLGAHKHDGLALARAEGEHDVVAGVAVADEGDEVLHGAHGGLDRRGGVRHRVMHVLLDQLVDVAVKRGGEEQALAIVRREVEELAHLRQEAHVSHVVGLVEGCDLHVGEGELLLVDEVLCAAWGGDEDVDGAGECADVAVDVDAADDGEGT